MDIQGIGDENFLASSESPTAMQGGPPNIT
jgi:hypothetical protein